MVYVKSTVVGILALIISLTVWIVAMNLLLPSEQSPPPPRSQPIALSGSAPPVTFDLRSTWTTTPNWFVAGLAVLTFGLGFYWEFRRVGASVTVVQLFKENRS
jgi:F0F1-type ATP synthase membrane subunit a